MNVIRKLLHPWFSEIDTISQQIVEFEKQNHKEHQDLHKSIDKSLGKIIKRLSDIERAMTRTRPEPQMVVIKHKKTRR